MSLLKPFTLTPALSEANRPNTQRPSDPCTTRGKIEPRSCGLGNGNRSPARQHLILAQVDVPPCAMEKTAQKIPTPGHPVHPLFANMVEAFCQAKAGVVQEHDIWSHCKRTSKKRILFSTNKATNCMKTHTKRARCHATCRTITSK